MKRLTLSYCVLALLLAVFSCSTESESPDGGTARDSSVPRDGGSTDGSVLRDAGVNPDAGAFEWEPSTTVFVDQTLAAACSARTYSVAARDCTGSDGAGYPSIEEAFVAMQVGEAVLLRGGTYMENYGTTSQPTAMAVPTSKNGTSWSPGEYNVVRSFPGEWAILDGNGQYFTFGLGAPSWNSGSYTLRYWVFENLEIRGGSTGGIGVHEGPVVIRNCYIHDNGRGPLGDGNRGGIHAYRLRDSTIELNYLFNNSGADDNNKAHVVIFADYLYYDFDIDHSNQANTIRYNLFDTMSGTHTSIKDKASQHFSSVMGGIDRDMTYADRGSNIHHNIFLGSGVAVQGRQQFEQIHHNISVGGRITGEDGGRFRPVPHITVYNNTVFGAPISNTIGYTLSIAELDLGWYAVNNIVSAFDSTDYSPAFGIAVNWCRSSDCGAPCTYTWTGTRVEGNLVHNPMSSRHYGLPDSYTCKATRWLSTTDFNARRSATNYVDMSASLFVGATGADAYRTDPAHSITGGGTVGNSGVGGAHPYLAGRTLPTYIGATAPGDSAWVEGVLALEQVDMFAAAARARSFMLAE